MNKLWLLVALGVGGCASPKSLSLPPGRSVILPTEKATDLVRTCSREGPDIEDVWDPSQAEVDRLESDLGKLIGRRAKGCCVIDFSFESETDLGLVASYRQYAGVIVDGKRLIYVNVFPPYDADDSYWLSEPIYVCDGGPEYWGVLYDPERRHFSQLAFNGWI